VGLLDAVTEESDAGWWSPCGRPVAVFAEVVSAQRVAHRARNREPPRNAGVGTDRACDSDQATADVVAASDATALLKSAVRAPRSSWAGNMAPSRLARISHEQGTLAARLFVAEVARLPRGLPEVSGHGATRRASPVDVPNCGQFGYGL